MTNLKRYYTDLVDRAVKSGAQGAVMAITLESVEVNAFAIDFTLTAGLAGGMALLSLLTNVGQRGIFGRE